MVKPFSPEVGSEVSEAEAKQWIEKYDAQLKDKGKDTRSVFFGRDILLSLLAQHGCSGISFMFAMRYSEYAKKEVLSLVLVGRREDGTLIWPDNSEGKDAISMATKSGMTVDHGTYCPPYC